MKKLGRGQNPIRGFIQITSNLFNRLERRRITEIQVMDAQLANEEGFTYLEATFLIKEGKSTLAVISASGQCLLPNGENHVDWDSLVYEIHQYVDLLFRLGVNMEFYTESPEDSFNESESDNTSECSFSITPHWMKQIIENTKIVM